MTIAKLLFCICLLVATLWSAGCSSAQLDGLEAKAAQVLAQRGADYRQRAETLMFSTDPEVAAAAKKQAQKEAILRRIKANNRMAAAVGNRWKKEGPQAGIAQRMMKQSMAAQDAVLKGSKSHCGDPVVLRAASHRQARASRASKAVHANSTLSLEREAAMINEAALESKKATGALDFDLQVQDMSKTVLGIILGGGAGSRLYPLTKTRAKPAVPLGANYRLIDIPVSNCINSNVNKVYCLTQFNSASLNRHLSQAYNANVGGYSSRGFVEVLAASQSPVQKKWFQGTADAVRQYLWLFENSMREGVEDFLILAGDHLYRMNYQDFVLRHRKTGADITVAALPSDEKKATAFGLMKIDGAGRIIDFAEKPQGDALRAMRVDTTILGLDAARAKEEPYIASMGIYVAKASAIRDLLTKHFPEANDFGSEVIPGAKDMGMHIQAYLYDGYWEDIGTIEAFYEANLALTDSPSPKFSFYDRDAPIYTMSRFLPPSKVQDSEVNNSILGDGCVIRAGSRVNHSVIGLRTLINEGCTVDDALIMGADYYETMEECALVPGCLPMGLGSNTTVRRCIIDKNARIGPNCKIINTANVQEANKEDEGYVIKDGIVVVIKSSVFPEGTVI